MKRKESMEDKARYKGVSRGTIIAVFIVAFVMIMTMSYPMIVETDDGKSFKIIWEGNLAMAEGDPGAGASGFLEIFFTNHTASPGTAYTENDSTELESWCTANMPGRTPYASADNFNLEIDHSTSFDIVVRVRFNKTHAWDGSQFIDADTRCEMQVNSSNWADGEDITNATDGVITPSYNNTGEDYIWINFYWNAADNNGYQLAKNGVITIARIYISANF